jgi:flavin reductase
MNSPPLSQTTGIQPFMKISQADFRKALGCFATGVTVITVDEAGEVHGMTANAFSSVSLDPPLVLVCVGHQARTHAFLQAKKRFGVNVLAADQRAISEYYARATETHQHAEQAGARFDRTSHGTPVLHGALAYLECRLHSAQEAGDHTIFIAEVEDVTVREGDPLLFFRGKYRQVGGEISASASDHEESKNERSHGAQGRLLTRSLRNRRH